MSQFSIRWFLTLNCLSQKARQLQPIFKLTLRRTYYERGFFNVTVAFDKFVRQTEGRVELLLGNSGRMIEGKGDRSANKNGTARIFGGAELRDWFQKTHGMLDVINVDLKSVHSIRNHQRREPFRSSQIRVWEQYQYDVTAAAVHRKRSSRGDPNPLQIGPTVGADRPRETRRFLFHGGQPRLENQSTSQ